MGKNVKAIFIVFLILFAVSFQGITVSANGRPTPSVKITVNNAPKDYYIALLGKNSESEYDTDKTVDAAQNSELVCEDYSVEGVRKYLENFYYDGWTCYDQVVGLHYFKSNEDNTYDFIFTAEDNYRLAVITPDGRVTLSEEFTRRAYHAESMLNFSNGTVLEESAQKVMKKVITVASFYVLTELSELLILVLFQYPLILQNVLCVVLLNAITNITMNIRIVNDNSGFAVVFLVFFMEILVIFVESMVYFFVLENKYGRIDHGRNIVYGICANLFSDFVSIICAFIYAVYIA